MTQAFYTNEQIASIVSILDEVLGKGSFKAVIFGSRVDGSARPGSDLDLMIFPEKTLSWEQLGILREMFENSSLPFPVDVSDATVADAEFVTRVKTQGICISH